MVTQMSSNPLKKLTNNGDRNEVRKAKPKAQKITKSVTLKKNCRLPICFLISRLMSLPKIVSKVAIIERQMADIYSRIQPDVVFKISKIKSIVIPVVFIVSTPS